MPREEEVWQWWVSDPERVKAKPHLTSYFMSAATALARHPGAKPEPRSRKLQTVYEPGEYPPPNSKPGGR